MMRRAPIKRRAHRKDAPFPREVEAFFATMKNLREIADNGKLTCATCGVKLHVSSTLVSDAVIVVDLRCNPVRPAFMCRECFARVGAMRNGEVFARNYWGLLAKQEAERNTVDVTGSRFSSVGILSRAEFVTACIVAADSSGKCR